MENMNTTNTTDQVRRSGQRKNTTMGMIPYCTDINTVEMNSLLGNAMGLLKAIRKEHHVNMTPVLKIHVTATNDNKAHIANVAHMTPLHGEELAVYGHEIMKALRERHVSITYTDNTCVIEWQLNDDGEYDESDCYYLITDGWHTCDTQYQQAVDTINRYRHILSIMNTE